jgi:voltage-gated anion channel
MAMAMRTHAEAGRLAGAIPPGAAAPVMGTGIVSVALERDGAHTASDVLLVVAIALALWLAARAAAAARSDPAGVWREAASFGGLTFVAALCVLGTRLTPAGGRAAGAVLLAAAVAIWAPVLVAVLRRRPRRARGDAFLVSVSTQAIAVLCAMFGAVGPAVVAFAAGLVLYAWALAVFDLDEIRSGGGDQWIAGGALAIAALAAATTAAHARAGHGALDAAAFGLWLAALAWLPGLLAGEALRPRAGSAVRRWSTVFPVGMYAAMSFAAGDETGRPWMVTFARGWTWVAVAVWAVVAAASLRRAL